MKYYLHDTSAFLDEKITELYINFGYEGLGLFYTILEKIAFQFGSIIFELDLPFQKSLINSIIDTNMKDRELWITQNS